MARPIRAADPRRTIACVINPLYGSDRDRGIDTTLGGVRVQWLIVGNRTEYFGCTLGWCVPAAGLAMRSGPAVVLSTST
jgi:hypothetical protein